MYRLGDIAKAAPQTAAQLTNYQSRGLLPLSSDDMKSDVGGRASLYCELSARLIALAATACAAGMPPKAAFRAAQRYADRQASNQFFIGEEGRVAPHHQVGQREPGRPFATGDSWFACRMDGSSALINAPAGYLNAGSVRHCLEGESTRSPSTSSRKQAGLRAFGE